ncbi:MAG: isochorismatase family protein, partial [Zoogloea sp.]|nr:isochorismatase family protein [Zoogloea sp.]
MSEQAKRALIVIDVQNEYISGNLLIEYPDVQQSLANICRAMDAAHAAGIPVVVVQHLAPEGAPIFARGSQLAELHPQVAARPRELLVEKQ